MFTSSGESKVVFERANVALERIFDGSGLLVDVDGLCKDNSLRSVKSVVEGKSSSPNVLTEDWGLIFSSLLGTGRFEISRRARFSLQRACFDTSI